MNDDWDREVDEMNAALAALRAELHEIGSPIEPLWLPPLMEFILSPKYLHKKRVYPRQATMLKTIFLDEDALTPYDENVLAEWGAGFALGAPDELLGGWWYEPSGREPDAKGTTPDVRDRIRLQRARGRRYFPQVNFVGGRRGGKGDIAATSIGRVLWELLCLDEPQAHVHADRGKTLTIDIFAANKVQARDNVFADVVRTLAHAPCFAPYIVEIRRDRMVLATPYDLRTHGPGFGTIEIAARETTVIAGRGQTSIVQVYDEMAWSLPGTSKAPADEVFGAATPALDQARGWSLILTLSSPYQRVGTIYELNARARQINPATGAALYPEIIAFQFASWDPYLDWELAPQLPLVNEATAAASDWFRLPDGSVRTFPPTGGPVSVYDEQMRQEERADPVRFRVERRGQWADVADPFLNAVWIETMWRGPDGEPFEREHAGVLAHDYFMHIDAASKHDPYALAIGRAITIEGRRYALIVRIARWLPTADRHDLETIHDEIAELIRCFNPVQVTVDQHGGEFLVDELNRRLRGVSTPRHRSIFVRHHTAKLNERTTELFRDFMRAGRVHSYYDRQLDLELHFLQYQNGKVAAPTTGFVTTDDVADAVMVVVVELLDPGSGAAHQALSDLPLGGRPGLDPNDPTAQALTAGMRRGLPAQRPGVGRLLPPGWSSRPRRRW